MNEVKETKSPYEAIVDAASEINRRRLDWAERLEIGTGVLPLQNLDPLEVQMRLDFREALAGVLVEARKIAAKLDIDWAELTAEVQNAD